jgi:hypothetical protein
MGQVLEARWANEFQCPCCGALYEVAVQPLGSPSRGDDICQVCHMVMTEWRGTLERHYALKAEAPRPPIDSQRW